MSLDCIVIKVTHPEIDEAKYDGNFGWIDRGDQSDLVIEGLMEHHEIESRHEFEVDTYKIDSEEIMEIIEQKEAN
jgi:hypothetical protein